MDTEPQTKIFNLNDFRKSIFLLFCATSDLQSNIIFSKRTQEMLAASNTSSVLAVCNDNVYLLYAAKQTTKICLTLHCWWKTYCELRNEQRGQASHKQGVISKSTVTTVPVPYMYGGFYKLHSLPTIFHQVPLQTTMFTTSHIISRVHLKNLCGLSPRANYTNQATAACRRSQCQLLWLEGVTRSEQRILLIVFLIF
jgi:hypothetical protein